MVMTTKKNLIKTIMMFNKVKDIDCDYIYTYAEFEIPHISEGVEFEWGSVIEVFRNEMVTVSATHEADCGCCSYSQHINLRLQDLTITSLQSMIDSYEKLLPA
jgi:hypothetical protein